MLIGVFIDYLVGKLNWVTGGDFKDIELSDEAKEQLAEAADAPVPVVQRAIASAGPGASAEDRIKALYEQYGIKPDPAPVKETPQQETVQAQAPTSAPAQAPQPSPDYGWDKILSFILRWEGGYANDPDDRGGETNMGITRDTLALSFAQGIVKNNDIKKLTKEDASKIYAARYYLCYGYEKLPFPVSLALTDTTVNHGRGGAAEIVQRALVSLGYGLTVDGKWGPRTQEAVEKASSDMPQQLARLVLVKRRNRYDGIISSSPSQAKFRNGWYNRLNALADECGVLRPA
jgi:hypothetical protein